MFLLGCPIQNFQTATSIFVQQTNASGKPQGPTPQIDKAKNKIFKISLAKKDVPIVAPLFSSSNFLLIVPSNFSSSYY